MSVVRIIVAALACLMLIAAPVNAQTTQPTPEPEVSSLTRDITESVQAIGANNFILSGIVVLMLVAAWRGLAPLLNTLRTINEQNLTLSGQNRVLNDQLMERLRAGDEERARTASINQTNAESGKRMAAILSDIETRPQAEAARINAVKQVNDHTDAALTEPKADIKQLLQKLDSLIDKVTTAEAARTAQHKEVNGTLANVAKELGDLRQIIQTLAAEASTLGKAEVTSPVKADEG